MPSFTPLNIDELTPRETEVLEEYTTGESLWINNYLRNRNMEQLSNSQKDKLRNSSIHLNNVINRSHVSTSTTKVYRRAEAMEEKWKNLKPGDDLLFTQKGLISTTFQKDVAISFIEDDCDCCLLVLTLPKGTKGLYISTASGFNELEEDELLLPHGSKFQVTSRKKVKYNSREIITYYATLISQL